jgi:NAD(P)-dependent dehydrogenase (short-subunit alcohol dehydrogenase family)
MNAMANNPMSGTPRKDLKWHPGTIGVYGKRVAAVGGTGGIGQAVARVLASQGAKVTVVGQTFRDQGTANLEFLKADLSSMKEAVRVARTLKEQQPDLWLLTTGIYAGPRREETAEGLEKDMAVSFLSRLAMIQELGSAWTSPAPSGTHRPRVFVWGFPGTGLLGAMADDLNAERSYGSNAVHYTTVAGNEALVLWAAKKYPGAAFFGMNPGLIKTNIRANVLGGNESLRFKMLESMIGLFTPTPDKYATRTVPLLLSPELDQHSGAFFNQKTLPIKTSDGMDDAHVTKLITGSQALVERALKTANA